MTFKISGFVSTLLLPALLLLAICCNGCYKNSDYSPVQWSNGKGIFYYYFDETHMNVNYYYAMAYAMNAFNRRTDVRWYYRPNISPYKNNNKLIKVYSEAPGSKTVNSWSNGNLKIYDNFGHVYYKAVHEAAHGVGFLHEHQRSDKPSEVYQCGDPDFQTISMSHISLCLDVKTGSFANGKLIQMYSCHGDVNQRFYYNEITKQIKTYNGDYCLDVHGPDYTNNINGAKVQIWSCNRNDNQKWDIVGKQIQSANGKCLDIDGGSKLSQLWDCHGGLNQQFQWEGSAQRNPFPMSFFPPYNCFFRQRIIIYPTNIRKQCIVPVKGNYAVGNQLTLGDCPSDHYIWYEHTTDTIRVDKDNCLAVDAQDYNVPRHAGKITIQPCNLSEKRFKFKLVNQQEMESYNGQGVDVSGSIYNPNLQLWTKGVTNDRFQIDYEDNYWKYDRWSILHYGNEIGGYINAAYGECSGRNRHDTCGDDDCKKVIGGISLSNSDISRINNIYKTEVSNRRLNPNNMPTGYYSYLMPKDSGCPTRFEDSAFYFDDEDYENDNTQSSAFWSKFVGGNARGVGRVGDRSVPTFWSKFMGGNDVAKRSGTLLYFCASVNTGTSSRTFADIPGQYCFMIRNGQSCPSGFAYSYFDSDDEDDDNESKAFGKVHVVYKNSHGNSITKYCCKNDGRKNRAVHVMDSISSNNVNAFSLFPLYNAGGCQKVHFYEDTQHWVERDSEDDSTTNNWHGDWKIRPDSSGEEQRHFKMQVCHYKRNDKRISNKIYMNGNGLCLDVMYYGTFSNGKRIVMFNCHGRENQRFYYNEMTREIRTYNDDYCLDVHGPDYYSNSNGAKVQIWFCNGEIHQKWDIIGTQIQSPNGKCLDIDGGSKLSQLWDCHGGLNQQFEWNDPQPI